MANKVNAIVIDPETKTIYPTTVTKGSKGFHEIYEQIGCDNLEVGDEQAGVPGLSWRLSDR